MLSELYDEVRAEFPGFRIVRKDESWLMKAVSAALMVLTLGMMRTFMTRFITTIGHTVYVPADWEQMTELSRYIVIRHERVHMRQARRWGRIPFSVAYLLLPLPMGLAYFRARFEMEAYAESARALIEQTGTAAALSRAYQDRIVEHFVSAEYGWCWPFRKTVERWVREAVEAAVDEYVGRKPPSP